MNSHSLFKLLVSASILLLADISFSQSINFDRVLNAFERDAVEDVYIELKKIDEDFFIE